MTTSLLFMPFVQGPSAFLDSLWPFLAAIVVRGRSVLMPLPSRAPEVTWDKISFFYMKFLQYPMTGFPGIFSAPLIYIYILGDKKKDGRSAFSALLQSLLTCDTVC